MTQLSLSDLSKRMADIDYAMLSTRTASGWINARPMNNNGDVEYDGNSYFFAFDHAYSIKDIERDPKIGISYVGTKGLLNKPRVFISIEATAELIRDKAAFKQHWNSNIEAWAADGIDTPGLVLIKAHAARIHYWDGHEEGELIL
jgi:general stress protein 26